MPSINHTYHLHHHTQHFLFATLCTGVTSLHSSYWLACKIEELCVLCEVGTEVQFRLTFAFQTVDFRRVRQTVKATISFLWFVYRSVRPSARNNSASHIFMKFNPLNAELNPICHFLALLGAHHILHVSRIRINMSIFLTSVKKVYVSLKSDKNNGCNPLNAELNPICHFLALLGAHHILHVSSIRINLSIFLTSVQKIHVSLKSDKNNGWNTLSAELNPICHFLALLGAHHILHVSRIRINMSIFLTSIQKVHVSLKSDNNNGWNPLNAELNPIRHFLALLGAHHILHVSRMRVNMSIFLTSVQKIHVSLKSDKNNGWNPLSAELNSICHFLALLGAHHILHVSRIRINMSIFLTSVQKIHVSLKSDKNNGCFTWSPEYSEDNMALSSS